MILVTGATGFIGRYLVSKLLESGQKVRALVRSETRSEILPKSTQIVVGDILDLSSLKNACDGVDGVIHLASTIREVGDCTFQSLNYHGTRNVISAIKETGTKRLVYTSAVGSTSNPSIPYLHSRWMAEQEVIRSDIPSTILRFSVGFGTGDQFFNQIAALVKLFPIVPVVGDGKALFQPIHVDDVARCISEAYIDDDKISQTVDIGGPEHYTYDEIVEVISETLGAKTLKMHTPIRLMSPVAMLLETLVPSPPVTPEQLKILKLNNITDLDSVVRHFGFEPRRVRGNIGYIQQIGLVDALKMNIGFMPNHIRDH